MYELDYKKPILYVIPIESILGKLPVVPVGDTGTIPHPLRTHFPGAARRPPAGFWRRMQDVVCQLMGIGMVPRYVMKAKGVQGTAQHGEVVLLYQLFQLE
jgi:hypothetical protein